MIGVKAEPAAKGAKGNPTPFSGTYVRSGGLRRAGGRLRTNEQNKSGGVPSRRSVRPPARGIRTPQMLVASSSRRRHPVRRYWRGRRRARWGGTRLTAATLGTNEARLCPPFLGATVSEWRLGENFEIVERSRQANSWYPFVYAPSKILSRAQSTTLRTY